LIGVYKGVIGEKFCIIDPNNSLNDISGGARNTPVIRRAFSQAYQDLQKRMYELHETPIDQRRFQSILGVILGGNYSSFEVQRKRLWEHYETMKSL
jgi:non-canonical poly(A) RNA polymerase PAPD5/7